MKDKVMQAFLAAQLKAAMALAGASDLLDLRPSAGKPPQRYRAHYRCKGLVRDSDGEIVEADHFEVSIWFPHDYLRVAHPAKTLTWLGPANIWHPNIHGLAGAMCTGRLAPGTPLVDILYQCFEIITYRNVTMREDDALNKPACSWARQHQHLFPIDRRPLKRRPLKLDVKVTEKGAAS